MLLLLRTGSGVKAQVNKVIEIPGASTQLASAIVAVENDFVLYGAYVDTDGYQKLFLYRLNDQFDSLNFKSFFFPGESNGYSSGFVKDDHDNLIFLSKFQDSTGIIKTKLIKTDPSFQIIWQKNFQNNTSYFGGSRLVQHPDGGFIIAGQVAEQGENGADIFILRTDSLGNELWREEYGIANFTEIPLNIYFIKNEEYYIPFGREFFYNDGLWGYGGYLLKYSYSNSSFVIKDFHRPFQYEAALIDILSTYDGCFIGVGYFSDGNDDFFSYNWMNKGRLTKIDSAMNIIYDLEIGLDYYKRSGLNHINKLSEGSYILGGGYIKTYNTNPSLPMIWCVKYSDTLGIIWERNYYYYSNLGAENIQYKMLRLPNNQIVFTGYAFGDTPPIKIWIVKTDSFGCVVPGCQIYDGIENPAEQLGMQIYPNPAQDFLNIYVPPGKDHEDVRIYDSQGRLVQTLNVLPAAATTIVSVRNLAPGLYFLSHQGEGIKFVKE